MPIQVDKRPKSRQAEETAPSGQEQTAIGWQGIRCILPPEWNLTGFSMDRDNGYLRVDAPPGSDLSVQIRWQNASQPQEARLTLYTLLMTQWRKWRKLPSPPVPKPNIKANLEKILKETAKQARKAKSAFESSIKSERTEGPEGERSAINFSWMGGGRGQGKIWYCSVCHRIVVAQVVGMARDQAAMAAVASQLFASLHDHDVEGYDLWALYDLQMWTPSDFRLEDQKLLSGHLQLTFGRSGEKIVMDRWGLANMTLKKFKLEEWFRNNAGTNLKRLTRTVEEAETIERHPITRYSGALSLLDRVRMLREARGSLRRFATRYEGGVWECPESNKIFSVQVYHNRRTVGLWEEIVKRCLCHRV